MKQQLKKLTVVLQVDKITHRSNKQHWQLSFMLLQKRFFMFLKFEVAWNEYTKVKNNSLPNNTGE